MRYDHSALKIKRCTGIDFIPKVTIKGKSGLLLKLPRKASIGRLANLIL